MPSLRCTAAECGPSVRNLLIIFSLLGGASYSVQAANEGKTNEATFSYTSPSILVETHPDLDVFRQNLINELATSEDIVFDRILGPAAQLSWARRQNNLGYASVDRFNSDGASLFTRIGADSLRNAVVESFPTEFWQEHWLGWFGNLINGTLGNSEEERVRLTTVSYSAVRSSWEKSGKDTSFQWGLRPWNTSPYIYFLVQAGHFERKPLLTLESRAGYDIFGSSKVEARLTVELPASFRIAASAAMDPGKVNSMEPGSKYVGVTLERLIGGPNPTALFYVGFRSGIRDTTTNPRHESMIVAGLFKRL